MIFVDLLSSNSVHESFNGAILKLVPGDRLYGCQRHIQRLRKYYSLGSGIEYVEIPNIIFRFSSLRLCILIYVLFRHQKQSVCLLSISVGQFSVLPLARNFNKSIIIFLHSLPSVYDRSFKTKIFLKSIALITILKRTNIKFVVQRTEALESALVLQVANSIGTTIYAPHPQIINDGDEYLPSVDENNMKNRRIIFLGSSRIGKNSELFQWLADQNPQYNFVQISQNFDFNTNVLHLTTEKPFSQCLDQSDIVFNCYESNLNKFNASGVFHDALAAHAWVLVNDDFFIAREFKVKRLIFIGAYELNAIRLFDNSYYIRSNEENKRLLDDK